MTGKLIDSLKLPVAVGTGQFEVSEQKAVLSTYSRRDLEGIKLSRNHSVTADTNPNPQLMKSYSLRKLVTGFAVAALTP